MKRGATMNKDHEAILTLSCPDRRGIVHAVSGFLSGLACNILHSAQFGDTLTNTFFMRVHFRAEEDHVDDIREKFARVALDFDMEWQLHDASHKPRVLLMVSKFGHCLNDLLYRYRSGLLHADVRGVVSNHRDFEALTRVDDTPFHYLPVSNANRVEQEAALLELIERERIELIVLARYMQVLSDDMCRQMHGKVINIHHSFLPSFKGARPYAQAHARGVKLIGATAHFVTGDLDEGPIIEQDVARVNHAYSADQLTAIGRDVESIVLARAVNWFLEHRIVQNGDKTVVFAA